MGRGSAEQRRNRWRVRRLASARVVSAGGSQAAQIALVYQIYALTHSGRWVAGALFASVSVGGLLGPVSGWVADRFDRRRVMVLSELAAGGAYLVMVFLHAPTWLMVGALLATVLGAPFRSASAAAIPNLVEPADLPWANGLLGTAFNLALVAGPLVGGALVAASGARFVFGVNAATFLVSGVLIGLTPGSFGGRQPAESVGEEARTVFAGFRLLAGSRLLGWLAASSTLAFGAFGAALVIDPVLTRSFHAGSVGYGLLTTVWGAGAVGGALVAGRTVKVDGAATAVVWGMAGMAVSLGSIAVLPTFALIVAAGALGGVGNGFVFIPWLLLVQHHTDDAVRGRVIAASEAFEQIAFLAGMGAVVPVIALVGAHRAYAIPGVLLAVAALAALAAIRAERPITASPFPASEYGLAGGPRERSGGHPPTTRVCRRPAQVTRGDDADHPAGFDDHDPAIGRQREIPRHRHQIVIRAADRRLGGRAGHRADGGERPPVDPNALDTAQGDQPCEPTA
jgi:MFS family permease